MDETTTAPFDAVTNLRWWIALPVDLLTAVKAKP
jgi:hypothetical protein